jgi:hypothetical protein
MTPASSLELKTCPSHPGGPTDLPRSAFGICRSRADGQNLYCKACIRTKVNEQRAAIREWKKLRNLPRKPMVIATVSAVPAMNGQLSWMASLVLQACSGGQRTQYDIIRSIVRTTRRTYGRVEEDVGVALADLFDARLIATLVEGETRVYFPRKKQRVA